MLGRILKDWLIDHPTSWDYARISDRYLFSGRSISHSIWTLHLLPSDPQYQNTWAIGRSVTLEGHMAWVIDTFRCGYATNCKWSLSMDWKGQLATPRTWRRAILVSPFSKHAKQGSSQLICCFKFSMHLIMWPKMLEFSPHRRAWQPPSWEARMTIN